ncbi:MAG TPA: hypothetical protein VJZ04_05445 [Lachnospiraceae bacterium]|nr:hypothetical protein [Lachnospiraceae bacterium]
MNYSNIKVHNEIAFCTLTNFDLKNQIEKEFIKESISYYEKWENIGFIKRVFGMRTGCTICINQMQKEKAEEIIIGMKLHEKIDIICKPIEKKFF